MLGRRYGRGWRVSDRHPPHLQPVTAQHEGHVPLGEPAHVQVGVRLVEQAAERLIDQGEERVGEVVAVGRGASGPSGPSPIGDVGPATASIRLRLPTGSAAVGVPGYAVAVEVAADAGVG
jgi:hypothetical protein